jgi:hypothetical protein
VTRGILGTSVQDLCELADQNILAPVLRGEEVLPLALEFERHPVSLLASLTPVDPNAMAGEASESPGGVSEEDTSEIEGRGDQSILPESSEEEVESS